jgi:hypothetical protein
MRRISLKLLIVFCLSMEWRTCSLVRADMANDVTGSGKLRLDDPASMIRLGMSINEIDYLLEERPVFYSGGCGHVLIGAENSWCIYSHAHVTILYEKGIATVIERWVSRGRETDAKHNKDTHESRHASPTDEKVNRLGGHGGN